MNPTSLANTIQIVTGVALIAGIGLVIWELKQSRDLAEAQFISDGYEALVGHNLAMMGENAADVFARACDDPDSLTSADARVMEAMTWNKLLRISRRLELYRVGGFYGDDPENGWSKFAASLLRGLLDTDFGKNWWRTTRSFWDKEIVAIGDEILASDQLNRCSDFYNALLGHESEGI